MWDVVPLELIPFDSGPGLGEGGGGGMMTSPPKCMFISIRLLHAIEFSVSCLLFNSPTYFAQHEI